MAFVSGYEANCVQDFIAGCFGGAGQLISGHPFDTIKASSDSMRGM